MDFIKTSLSRLQAATSQFVRPNSDLSDISVVKSQIELRRRALKEIEVIRSLLRPPTIMLRRASASPRAAKFVSTNVHVARARYSKAMDNRRAARLRAQTGLAQIH